MKWKIGIKNLTHNLPLLISLLGVACLNVLSVKTMLAAAAAVAIGTVLSFWKRPAWKPERAAAIGLSLLWAAIVVFLAVRFYLQMQDNVMTLIYAEFIGVYGRDLALDLAVLGSVLAMTAVIYGWMPSIQSQSTPTAQSVPTRRLLIAAFATALAVIGICSKSSPIYPFNDWLDANCFMTVGKSMLHGLVPYRDLYEQKGPLLYMLHAAAALVSDTSFIGVFFLEVLAATAFLFLSYRTVELFRQGMSLLWLPLIAAVAYSTTSFCHGDSAEELCLPLLAYGIYCGVKAITEKRLPNRRECILVGITSACVLWTKFTMLGFYLGWFAAFFLLALKRRELPALVRMLGQILLGVVITSIPVIGYFALNGALSDLFTVYFYNNLFLYSSAGAARPFYVAFLNLAGGLQHLVHTNRLPRIFLIIAMVGLIKSRRFSEGLFVVLCWVGLLLLVYIGGRRYTYYSLIFSVFAPMAIPAFWGIQQGLTRLSGGRKAWKIMAVAASLLFAFAMCDNTYLLKYKKSDMPQYQFAQIIRQKENPTLLNWGYLDGGFYTTADIVPNCRYFCLLNIPLEEMTTELHRYLEEGLADFVVTQDELLEANNYVLVAESSFFFEEGDHIYRLYQQK